MKRVCRSYLSQLMLSFSNGFLATCILCFSSQYISRRGASLGSWTRGSLKIIANWHNEKLPTAIMKNYQLAQ